MRMDRYEEKDNINDFKQSRLHKNQELYTDVYLNNVYVDINNLKEVMKEEKETIEENVKIVKESNQMAKYSYHEKNYDIKNIIEEVIKNKKDDNIKRSLSDKNDDSIINNLVELIQEKDNIKEEKEQELEKENNISIEIDENKEENLLSDLLPTDDNTEVMSPLSEPIHLEDIKSDLKKKNEIDEDFVFLEEKQSKVKIVLIAIIIILLIALLIGFCFYRDIL